MTVSHISFQEIQKDPDSYQWVWNFLEENAKKGIVEWFNSNTYQYKKRVFCFEHNVFLRQKKAAHNYSDHVYEEKPNTNFLGSGASASVFNISFTYSRSKTGQYQVRDKGRVVKVEAEDVANSECQLSK